MKKSIKIAGLFLILIIAIIISGCKFKEKVVEKTLLVKDSTEISELKNKLDSSENQILSLSEQLKESRKENERLQSNAAFTIKEFDTDKPNAPIKRETHYNQSYSAEKQIVIDREMEISLKSEINSLKSENSELNKKVEFLEKLNKEVKVDKSVKSKFQWWLIFVGFVCGLAFYYYFGSIVRFLFKKKINDINH